MSSMQMSLEEYFKDCDVFTTKEAYDVLKKYKKEKMPISSYRDDRDR